MATAKGLARTKAVLKSSTATSLKSRRVYLLGMVAGAVLSVSAIGKLGWDVGHWVWHHPEAFQSWVSGPKAPTTPATIQADRFPNPVYIAMYTKGNDPDGIQVWKLTVKGWDTLTGEIQDIKTLGKGVVSGHFRAGSLVLEYASADPSRPGFGAFILRELKTMAETQGPVFAGMAAVHDCECATHYVRFDGPILQVSTVLTASPIVSPELKEAFLKVEPQKASVVWPADFLRKKTSGNS
jgi:hypothetical protein